MLGLKVAYQEDISFYTPDSCTSFCASSICLTSLEGAKVTAHNLPRVDKFVTYSTAKTNLLCKQSIWLLQLRDFSENL